MPEREGGQLDPGYIRERIREDFLPMARQCYEQLLTRSPGAAGRSTLRFTILGDEREGGVVDDTVLVNRDAGATDGGLASLADAPVEDGGLGDREFQTCLRETMNTMVFRPPTHGGRVTVVYPFSFSPGADGG